MKSGIAFLLLISVFIAGLAFISCINGPKEEKSPGQVIYEEVIEQVEERVLSDEWMERRIEKHWFEGHEYLVVVPVGRYAIGCDVLALTHNPNCPCKLEK